MIYRQGKIGDDAYLMGVKAIQQMLGFGYVLGDYADQPIDGVYGPATTGAVKLFQTRQKIWPVDGIVGPLTASALLTACIRPVASDPYQWARLAPFVQGQVV